MYQIHRKKLDRFIQENTTTVLEGGILLNHYSVKNIDETVDLGQVSVNQAKSKLEKILEDNNEGDYYGFELNGQLFELGIDKQDLLLRVETREFRFEGKISKNTSISFFVELLESFVKQSKDIIKVNTKGSIYKILLGFLVVAVALVMVIIKLSN